MYSCFAGPHIVAHKHSWWAHQQPEIHCSFKDEKSKEANRRKQQYIEIFEATVTVLNEKFCCFSHLCWLRQRHFSHAVELLTTPFTVPESNTNSSKEESENIPMHSGDHIQAKSLSKLCKSPTVHEHDLPKCSLAGIVCFPFTEPRQCTDTGFSFSRQGANS